MTEDDLQGISNQEPFGKEIEVPTLSVSVTFVENYMGVIAIRSLEPATIMAKSGIMP